MLDGSWGVLLQGRGISEEEWRGERFRDHSHDVAGDPDLLNLTRPEVVSEIHRAYFDGRRGHRHHEHVHGDVDRAGRLRARGRRLRDEPRRRAPRARGCATRRNGFVAGSVGPLNVTLSLSPQVDDPSYRTATFDQVRDSYAEQIRALAEGGVDLLLIETIFDTLNAKAAIVAAQETAPDLPLWLSFTAIDLSGRNLSGQTVEAFLALGRARRAADRRRELLARRGPDAAVRRRTWRGSRRPTPPATRTPACRTSSARTTSGPRTRAASWASSRATASSTSSAAAAGRRPNTSRRSWTWPGV